MGSRDERQNIPQEFIDKAETLAVRYFPFTDGIRVLMLIQRHSDGGMTNNSKLRAYISRDTEDWKKCLAKLLEERSHYPDLPLRIYQTLNSRDIEKSIREFKYSSLDADFQAVEHRHWFYLDIKNRMVSALMKPNCRSQSQFLIDCDTKDEQAIHEVRGRLMELTSIIDMYPTKNGVHFITDAFNPNDFKFKDCEVKKDAMMLLTY